MNTKTVNTFICFLLVLVALFNSACGLSRIQAETPAGKPKMSPAHKVAESPAPVYKPLKRVSRDVITNDENMTKSQKR